jgi:Calcineurin-like phosphoesterase
MANHLISVFNDTHLGTIRSAGTTPASAYAMRRYLLETFYAQLQQVTNSLLINGDLFDKETIPMSDMGEVLVMLMDWVKEGRGHLYLSPGNHDLPKTSSNHSSFQFLGKFLSSMFPEQVTYIDKPMAIGSGCYVIPHLPNQDLLNAALEEVPECNVLFVHTNYDNNFAAQADQSLNISKQQAQDCKAEFIVFGHEHQTKTALGGKVIIPGNQIASSVADCLNCKDDQKFMVVLDATATPYMIPVAPLPYAEMDWKSLEPTDAKFIRVSGEAMPDQGAEVAQAISRYRSQSQAFVVANAVTMLSSESDATAFADSLESVQAFDVMAALLDYLTAEEAKTVKEVMNA